MYHLPFVVVVLNQLLMPMPMPIANANANARLMRGHDTSKWQNPDTHSTHAPPPTRTSLRPLQPPTRLAPVQHTRSCNRQNMCEQKTQEPLALALLSALVLALALALALALILALALASASPGGIKASHCECRLCMHFGMSEVHVAAVSVWDALRSVFVLQHFTHSTNNRAVATAQHNIAMPNTHVR